MKNILVLVDFTPMSLMAFNQALFLAKLHNATVVLCHITSNNDDKSNQEIAEKFQPFITKANETGVNCQTHITYGSLAAGASEAVARFRPDLVIAGTHGKRGIMQHMFGSKIFNLVKEIDSPCLVLNSQSKVAEKGFNKVLIPVSHHDTYLQMLEETTMLLASSAKVTIFAVVKYGLTLDLPIVKNIEKAKQFLDSKGIANEYLEIVSDKYSAGYSKSTLDFVKDQNVDLITIFTKVSAQNSPFALIDKENIILNNLGLTVLCADC